jgi:ATP-dependent DNA helicase PIF1
MGGATEACWTCFAADQESCTCGDAPAPVEELLRCAGCRADVAPTLEWQRGILDDSVRLRASCPGCESFLRYVPDEEPWRSRAPADRTDPTAGRSFAELIADLRRREAEAERERLEEVARLRASLNADQRRAVELLESGANVFLTGCAGTGKSYALSAWVRGLPRDREVAVTATTGIAALNVDGQTLHSWLGLGVDDRTVDDVVVKRFWRMNVQDRIREADVLLVDEVSMASGMLIDLAEGVCRYARQDDRPWGGLQVVMIGDFGQLAPVEVEEHGWAFRSQAWLASNVVRARLDQPMRTADPVLWQVLTEARAGRLTPGSLAILQGRVGAFDPRAEGATRLMTTNAQADGINDAELAALPGELREYHALDEGDGYQLEKLRKDCTSPTVLRLKVGARVSFTKNDPDGRWVNGSTGTVVALESQSPVPHLPGQILPPPAHEGPVVRLDDRRGERGATYHLERVKWERKQGKKVVASREQFPLRLSWAITIHKSQGATIDRVSTDLSSVFTPGQGYVAISRVRALEGLNIEAWCGAASFRAHSFIGKV